MRSLTARSIAARLVVAVNGVGAGRQISIANMGGLLDIARAVATITGLKGTSHYA